MSWSHTLLQLAANEEALVIVTVSGTRGSTPRETGAKMLVSMSNSFGTVGGGQLEHECLAIAAKWLRERTTPQTFSRRFTLGANCGQCCGGVVDILFEQIECKKAGWLTELQHSLEQKSAGVSLTATESFAGFEKRIVNMNRTGRDDALTRTAIRLHESDELPCRRTVTLDGLQVPVFFEALQPVGFEVTIFGAGHVGSALVASLAPLNCRVRWIDGRDDIFPASVPANTQVLNIDPLQTLAEQGTAGQYCVVMTHSHPLDLEICARILQRDDIAYCGLIGSVAKRRQFVKRLKNLGLNNTQIDRLICPIGIAGISGKKPAEIAVAVSAQLLQLAECQAETGVIPTVRLREVSQ
ncbi:MAG: xanthine dehydrogenase accessory protein XdhC [Gammaproteobacteria bacterium]|nr:xanthine dehydrogenase accessory protein XdhC [Gammaproteobacteria bacterium]